MGFTLCAYTESIATGVHSEVNAVADQHLVTSGKDIIIPDVYDKLVGLYMSSANITRGQISSPLLRKTLIHDADQLNIAALPASPINIMDLFETPRQLKATEGMRALITQTSGVAQQVHAIAMLGDGKIEPVGGEVMTVRCTATTAALVANVWNLVPLVFSQQLEAGRYQIVGARFEGAGYIAGRLIIPGSPWRPGAIGTTVLSAVPPWRFRRPRTGIWGEFSHAFPPQAEILTNATPTAHVVWLDLVKIS